MIRDIDRFTKNVYDLLVIGGGINGAAIAHLAAKRKMRVALLEKGDFASGASSKSTKLIHGGIRYLENLEFDLVYESLKERSLQLKAAPHLVKPLPFVIPVYKGDPRPLWMMKLGVFLYDLLAGRHKIGFSTEGEPRLGLQAGRHKVKSHKTLTREEVIALEPWIKQEGLVGGVIYYDAQMDDARLCLENVLAADAYGAHVANYVKVLSFLKENGRVTGVKAKDVLDGREFEVRAKKVVATVGPWTNELLQQDAPGAERKVRTTKGIHLVYKGQLSKHALLLGSQSDRRIFFVIPWMGNSLIGTTDTDYFAKADDVQVEQEDIDYLIREARRVFPDLPFGPERILAAFAGLRPLVCREGAPDKLSRKHLFYESPSGVIFVVGGKYTTYRKIAADCMNRIGRVYGDEDFKVYGSGTITETAETAAGRAGLEREVVQSLMDLYGTRYRDVLKLIEKDPGLKEKVSIDPPVLKAQLVYAVQTEMARTAADILERRLSLVFRGPVPAATRSVIESILTK